MSTAGEILILTGPPGAGKSTVARLLTERRLTPSVHLHADDFWACIKQGAIPPYLPESKTQNETVIAVLAQAATGYAAGGYQVVVDGVVGPWFLPPFKDAARAAGVASHYVVLRPDEPTTLRRGTTRGGHPLTDPEPIRLMYAQFADLGEYEDHALDTSGLDADSTADTVHTALADGRFRIDLSPSGD